MTKWNNYLKKEIWNIHIQDLPRRQAFVIRSLRVFMLILQGFKTKQIQQGAATLTYYSLMAVVPIIAFLFAILRGLFIQRPFIEWLERHFSEQKVVIDKIVEFASKVVTNAAQAPLVITALIIALWAGIKILIYIELVMNKIWGVRHNRSVSKRFSDYLAILFFCPFVVVLSTAITLAISTAMTDIQKSADLIRLVGPLRFIFFNALPIILTWLLLTFIYTFMPNTHVKFLPAFYSGIIIGSLYQIVQWLYFYLQVGVSHYNAIYGSFAAIPLFLIWVHLSWIIILVGAKLTFAIQNIKAYDVADLDVIISHRCRNIIALRIAHFCMRCFCTLDKPPTAKDISHHLQLSMGLTSQIIGKLVDSKVLVPIASDRQEEEGYFPGRPPEEMTIKSVIDMIENEGDTIKISTDNDLTILLAFMEEWGKAMECAEHNLLLKDF